MAFFVIAGSGCTTSYVHKMDLREVADPVSFKVSLGEFLNSQGLRPFSEIHSADPGFVKDVTGGLPRWDKDFPYSLRRGAGFVSVEVDPPYAPIGLYVGGTDNRQPEVDMLDEELAAWLQRTYPNVQINDQRLRYQRFPW